MTEKCFKRKKISYFKSGGFSLIEILVATGLISVSLVAIIGSFAQLVRANTMANNKTIALYLSQEGIEVVRNIRDTNWLKGDLGVSWDDGIGSGNFIPVLDLTSGEWELNTVGTGNTWKHQVYYNPNDKLFLQSKFQSSPQLPATWKRTIFFRKIIIDKDCSCTLSPLYYCKVQKLFSLLIRSASATYDPQLCFKVQSKVWFDNEAQAIITEEYFYNWKQ